MSKLSKAVIIPTYDCTTCAIGWSDSALFAILETGPIAADQVPYIFKRVKFQKIGEFDQAHSAKF